MTANEQLTRIQKRLDDFIDDFVEDIRHVRVSPLARKKRTSEFKEDIKQAFQQIQSLFDEQEEEHKEIWGYYDRDYDERDYIKKLRKHKEKIKALQFNIFGLQSDLTIANDKIKESGQSITILNLMEEKGFKRIQEQEKDIARLNKAFDDLYKLKEALRKGLEKQEKELDEKKSAIMLLEKEIVRLKG